MQQEPWKVLLAGRTETGIMTAADMTVMWLQARTDNNHWQTAGAKRENGFKETMTLDTGLK